MKRRLSTDTAATLCGFAVFLPVGVRGALFAICPALAGGRSRLFAKMFECAVFGALLDLAYQLAWSCSGLVWAPRAGVNRNLAEYLPPVHEIVPRSQSVVPNSVQFVVGLTGWTFCYFLLWVRLWPRSLPPRALRVGARARRAAGGPGRHAAVGRGAEKRMAGCGRG